MTPLRLTRFRYALAAAGVAVTTVVPWATAEVPGETGVQTGVWWQLQPADGALAPPGTDLSEGALWVQGAAGGDAAVSALRVVLPSGHRAASLVLTVREDASAPGAAAVDACPAAGQWTPPDGSPGAWSGRAVPDCSHVRVPGVRSESGTTMTFDLGQLIGERVDLVLIRAESAAAPVDITFEPPGPQALQTAAPGPADPAWTDSSAQGSEAVAEAAPGAELASALAPLEPSGTSAGDLDGGLLPAPAVLSPDVASSIPPEVADEASATAALAAHPAAAPDAGRAAAAAAFAVIVLWALMIRQRAALSGSARTGPTFTLYRGSPPATRPTR